MRKLGRALFVLSGIAVTQSFTSTCTTGDAHALIVAGASSGAALTDAQSFIQGALRVHSGGQGQSQVEEMEMEMTRLEEAQRQEARREMDALASQVDRLQYIFRYVNPVPERPGGMEQLLAAGSDQAFIIRDWKHAAEYPSFEQLLAVDPNATYRSLASSVRAKDATGYSFNWFNKTNAVNTSYSWTRGWNRMTLLDWQGRQDRYVYGAPPPEYAERSTQRASLQLFGRDGKLRRPTLIIGHPGSTHDLHVDEPGVVHVQRAGEKRMLLWPASAVDTLYLHPGWHPLARHSIIGTCVADPRVKRIAPKFDVLQAQSVLLRPGDVLFMPPLWGHYTIASGSGLSLGYAHFVQNLTGKWWTKAATAQQTAEAERHISECLAGQGSETMLMSSRLSNIRANDLDNGRHKELEGDNMSVLGTCPFVDAKGNALAKSSMCQEELPLQKLVVTYLHRHTRNHWVNVLQLGAGHGTTSCAIAHTMAEHQVPGNVIAVEPDLSVLPALRKNLASNACDVSVVQDHHASLKRLQSQKGIQRLDVLVAPCQKCISRLLRENPMLFKQQLRLLFLQLPSAAGDAKELLDGLQAAGFNSVPGSEMHTEDPNLVSHVVLERLP